MGGCGGTAEEIKSELDSASLKPSASYVLADSQAPHKASSYWRQTGPRPLGLSEEHEANELPEYVLPRWNNRFKPTFT